MKIVNYTDLRLNLKKWMDSVVDNFEEVIIKRKNQKDLVMISLEEYNSLVETNYLLSGKNREVLLESLEEYKAGKKVIKDLVEE
ncbi:type II toxin-antitoxin system Phd/YefM family antitoxin [Portibacter marinus]|uniref:type II toxin-antitoxin system Phd/YefM family antitoxin n=1 Tax=Portibacter marinus TaxID=2898660 RepID=UPI001F2A00BB|nr:type II toxin-antitoxin system prevent-host-death family antitoxin [Portibacter marinus]